MRVRKYIAIMLLWSVAGWPGCTRGHQDEPASYPGARVISIDEIRFDDGDTFYLAGEPIRMLGFDAPETKSEEVGILYDQPYGRAAAESTRVWLTRAKRIEILFDGRGSYGRRLAHVFVDGELLGVRLMRHGLAYENVSHFGDNGFPELADRFLDAGATSPKPRFQQPYKWRRKHQQKAANR